jgi:hypothetical protein
MIVRTAASSRRRAPRQQRLVTASGGFGLCFEHVCLASLARSLAH